MSAAAGGDLWVLVGGFVLAYLLGSIPFGLILAKLSGAGDIRKIGSGNIGATNVLRTGRKGLAAATLLLDGGKGAAAVLIGWRFGAETAGVAALGAVVGHIFPVWLKFRGGKGVATAIGVHLALAWPVGLLACATWLIVAAVFRYSSLAALVAIALSPVYALWLVGGRHAEVAGIIAILVVVCHRENIRRLVAGTESRIGRKSTGDGDGSEGPP
ncbi:MAG: glycerol-3-phosphate 1-O-acyltransferase PlsY [Alphaproteobacteria bacterium]